MNIFGLDIKRIKQEKWKQPEREIVCDRCGFVKTTTGSSGGVDSRGNLYGHHYCLDGEMGTFRG